MNRPVQGVAKSSGVVHDNVPLISTRVGEVRAMEFLIHVTDFTFNAYFFVL